MDTRFLGPPRGEWCQTLTAAYRHATSSALLSLCMAMRCNSSYTECRACFRRLAVWAGGSLPNFVLRPHPQHRMQLLAVGTVIGRQKPPSCRPEAQLGRQSVLMRCSSPPHPASAIQIYSCRLFSPSLHSTSHIFTKHWNVLSPPVMHL